jgi:FkbM family methyltransferase
MRCNSVADLEPYIQRYFPTPGFFLEIGAWDGIHISNSYHLEQLGWDGVCVDPFPKNFQRRKARLVEVAISKEGGQREFVKVGVDRRHGGDVSYFSGFRDSLTTYWPVIQEHCEYEIVLVPTITIGELYRRYLLPSDIHFLSIDTEGSEEEILSSIDFNEFHYGMIMFEHNADSIVRERIGKHLNQWGYTFLDSTGIDDVYCSEELL